jgi:hypothetical protein
VDGSSVGEGDAGGEGARIDVAEGSVDKGVDEGSRVCCGGLTGVCSFVAVGKDAPSARQATISRHSSTAAHHRKVIPLLSVPRALKGVTTE